ncbi:MAG: TPM domain-containing protein [Candidatus Riflebacteria bacterium]|nr:TPM domain-containing protein [Candidatus Riflebacteria bacterium]
MKLRTNALLYGVLVFMILTLAGSSCLARSMPVRRVPLNDEMELLDDQMALEVKRMSQLLYRDFKSELAVLIISSTDGVNASDYALKVFNHWGLGQAGVDNGMLIMFAIDDRRVEIKPGTRYKHKFSESFCTSLLNNYVVPEMRAGRPAQGVFMAAREVAAEIRRFEKAKGSSGSSSPGEALPGQSQSSSSQSSNNYRSSSTNSGSGSSGSSGSGGTSGSSGSSGSSYSGSSRYSNPFNSPVLRFVLYVCIALWIAGGIFYYYMTFSKSTLLMSPWLFIILMLLSGFIIAFVASKAFNIADDPLDQVASGSGGVSLITFLWLFSHICPRCNKYMNVHTRTLHYATYYSSGLGEKTEHCDHCGYHRVSTYTIPRKTRSSSSSSSSSRSYSGGGRSSGGGGGASW